MINLELYRVFYWVATTGSISKAAKQLFTSQPAVSQAIKALEAKLGGTLFIRTPKGVTLTVEGEVLFQYVAPAYGLLQTAEQKFAELQQLKAGTLRLGVSDTLCKYYLLPYVERYTQQFPAVRLQVINQTTFEILDSLQRGSIDLGLVNLPLATQPELHITPLRPLQDCFIAGPNYRSWAENAVSPLTLSQQPLILLEKASNSRRFLDAWGEQQGLVWQPDIELGTVDLVVEFVKRNLGIACVVKEFVAAELEAGLVVEVRVEPALPARAIGLAQWKAAPVSAAVQAFITLLQHTEEEA